MASIYHFLTTHGLYDALVWSIVGGSVAWLIARHPIRMLLALLGLHAVHQQQIADRLDTDTPGGLTEVLDAIERSEPPYRPPTRKRP